MVLLVLTLSLIYLFIRIKFKQVISYKNAKVEIITLSIGNVLLFVLAGVYTFLPQFFDNLLPIFYLSVCITHFPKLWSDHEDLLSRIIIISLGILIFIPYINIISLLIGGYLIIWSKRGESRESISLLLMTFAMIITIFLKIHLILWIGAALFYITKHIYHTLQLLSMLQNTGKNVVTDPLTGLYNRRWLYKKLEQIAHKQKVGIIFCDIDNFKRLNDEKGHEHGDYVLQKTGEIMSSILKGNGQGCRYGGEELVGLVQNYGRTVGLAEKILETVHKELNITMSIGIAIGKGSGEEILKLADERMYISKTTGKNKITFENRQNSSEIYFIEDQANLEG